MDFKGASVAVRFLCVFLGLCRSAPGAMLGLCGTALGMRASRGPESCPCQRT